MSENKWETQPRDEQGQFAERPKFKHNRTKKKEGRRQKIKYHAGKAALFGSLAAVTKDPLAFVGAADSVIDLIESIIF